MLPHNICKNTLSFENTTATICDVSLAQKRTCVCGWVAQKMSGARARSRAELEPEGDGNVERNKQQECL